MARLKNLPLLVVAAACLLALSGCATGPYTSGIATPWAVAGVHSFKPKADALSPSPAKVDRQIARLLDDATPPMQDPDTRVAAR